MEIQNQNNPADVVVVEESAHNRKGHVRLGIGGDTREHNPRHANLSKAEARAVAYALLSYAEQISDMLNLDAGTFADEPHAATRR